MHACAHVCDVGMLRTSTLYNVCTTHLEVRLGARNDAHVVECDDRGLARQFLPVDRQSDETDISAEIKAINKSLN